VSELAGLGWLGECVCARERRPGHPRRDHGLMLNITLAHQDNLRPAGRHRAGSDQRGAGEGRSSRVTEHATPPGVGPFLAPEGQADDRLLDYVDTTGLGYLSLSALTPDERAARTERRATEQAAYLARRAAKRARRLGEAQARVVRLNERLRQAEAERARYAGLTGLADWGTPGTTYTVRRGRGGGDTPGGTLQLSGPVTRFLQAYDAFRAAHQRGDAAARRAAWAQAAGWWPHVSPAEQGNYGDEFAYMSAIMSGDVAASEQARTSRERTDAAERELRAARRRGGESMWEHLPGELRNEAERRRQQLQAGLEAAAGAAPAAAAKTLGLLALVAAGIAFAYGRGRR
jgi:hypothetical protein